MTVATVQRQVETNDQRMLSNAEAVEWLIANRSKIDSAMILSQKAVKTALEEIPSRGNRPYGLDLTTEEVNSISQARIQCLKEVLPVIPDASLRLALVAKTVLANPGCLEMSIWHSGCGTAHCIAGWAEHMLGDQAVALEPMFGTHTLGAVLLGVEASRYFYKTNSEALEFLAQFED